MKIIYVITGLEMGGAEKQVCLLADNMCERGHDVTIVSLGRNAKARPSNQSVVIHEFSMSKNPFSLIKAYFKLRSLVKKNAPDVIHSHLFHANLLCRLLRITIKIKKLITSSHSRNEGRKLRMHLYRTTSFLTDLNTNVSQDAVDETVRRKASPANKIEVVANGIDTFLNKKISGARSKIITEFNLDDSNKILLAVGRFTEAKDYPNLLNAFSKLLETRKDVRLFIVGEGDLLEDIKKLSKKLSLENFLFFTGLRHDIPTLMSACDLYVMSSAWEGLPLVIGEAMSCECLIVTTQCGGVAEILGDCGTIVPIRSPALLAKGIISALSLEESHKHDLMQCGKLRVNSIFSINSVTDKWIEIYNRS